MTVDTTSTATPPPPPPPQSLSSEYDDHRYQDSIDEEKLPLYIDEDFDRRKHSMKSNRMFRSTSYLYPIILSLVLIFGTIALVMILSRQHSCRLGQEERHRALALSIRCVHVGSSCVCPASYVHSSVDSSSCVPSASRCLRKCEQNAHCACHHLTNIDRCREVTRRWIDKQLLIGSVEFRHSTARTPDLKKTPLERYLLNEHKDNERLFFSADRRFAIRVHQEEDDYLLNEHWIHIESNTTDRHVIYSQIDVRTHSCRLSSVSDDGTVIHGHTHRCFGLDRSAPYFFAATCRDVLVLWHGMSHSTFEQQEDWTLVRHHFESTIPRLPVLLDPFHRYYSLYDDSMIEIKDLNGNVLGQFFTDIQRASEFDFIDHRGTLRVANQTHQQRFTSLDEHMWLDV